ncbi:hypothetical protein [Sneathiella litorea]|uniref:DUF998 domain-containing protein n=1 Tax=Sneathiella litorea TaxID=2606216 RepID=A0A6L8W7B5_9PROT|nr:hypothetical protein [Sneathiella litorea]MZR30991.1 hypothetical protein [Sneathiella litorea]
MTIKSILAPVLAGLGSLLWSATAFAAEEYISGTGPLNIFDGAAMMAMPLWVKIWLAFLMLTFLTGLVFFVWRRPIARWAAGGFILSLATGHAVFGALGLPMLSGAISIMHVVCWTPALVLLLIKRPFLDRQEGTAYRLWSAVMTGVILFSFVFDIPDGLAYIRHFSS